MLHAPAVKAWLDQGKWHTVPAREAVPLPLHVCKSLENAWDTCEIEDAWLLLCFLLMLWGGWSDAQRQDLRSLVLDQGSLVMAHKKLSLRYAVGRADKWNHRKELGPSPWASSLGSGAKRSWQRLSGSGTRGPGHLYINVVGISPLPRAIWAAQSG